MNLYSKVKTRVERVCKNSFSSINIQNFINSKLSIVKWFINQLVDNIYNKYDCQDHYRN